MNTALFPLRRFATALLPALLAWGLIPTSLRPAEAQAAFPVQTKTDGGFTLRLTGAEWGPRDQPSPFMDQYSRGLRVHYEIQAGHPVALKPGRPLSSYVSATLGSPTGDPLLGEAPFPFAHRGVPGPPAGAGNAAGSAVFWPDADPRWEQFPIDLTVADPSVPIVNGHFVEKVTFTSFPAPQDKTIPINQTVVTPNGVKVTLEKVGTKTYHTDGRQDFHKDYMLVFRWEAPLQTPDMLVMLDGGYSTFVDQNNVIVRDQGTLTDDQGHTRSGPFGESGDDRLDGLPGRNTFSMTALPSPDSKTLTLTLLLHEVSSSLARKPAYPHFHFVLTRSAVPLPPAGAAVPPLASAPVDGGVVEVNSVQALPNEGYLVHLLVRPTPGAAHLWRTRGVKVADDTGAEMPADTNRTFLWKSDGTPLQPGEQGQEIEASWARHGAAGLVQAKTLKVSAHLVEQERLPGVLVFHGLPVPAIGQVVDSGLPSVTLGPSAAGKSVQFRVRKVGAFSPEHPLSAMITEQIQSHRLSSGLAVVLEYALTGGGEVSRYGSGFGQIAAADERGRPLLDPLRAGLTYGDVLQDRPDPSSDSSLTLFLRAPAADIRQFGIRMNADLGLLTGRETDVTLPPVPAPVPPPMPGRTRP